MRPNALKEKFEICPIELAFLFPEDTFVLWHTIFTLEARSAIKARYWRGTGSELLEGIKLDQGFFGYDFIKARTDSGKWTLKHVTEI